MKQKDISKLELISKKDLVEKVDLDVMEAVVNHLQNLSSSFSDNLESMFQTYKVELAALKVSVILGVRICDKQVISAGLGCKSEFNKNLNFVSERIND